MLPVASVRERGLAAGPRRWIASLHALARHVARSPAAWVMAWASALGAVQAGALYVGLWLEHRPLPHPVAVGAAAVALAGLAGLCLGVFLFVRLVARRAGPRTAAVVGAIYYAFCATGASEPGLLPALALVPAGVLFSLLMPRGPWGALELPRA